MKSNLTKSALLGFAGRVLLALLAVRLWFWTQSLIGARPLLASGIGDGLLDVTAPLNAYFLHHAHAADLLLIASSATLDSLALSLLATYLFGRSVRPLFGLFLLLSMRQMMQALCSLPAPPNMIWHDPGFPTLLVTYSVGNDFFFSGHTAIAVFAALELTRYRRPWLTTVAAFLALFEIATVFALRFHYTMDVFTAVVTAFWVSTLCDRMAPSIDARLAIYLGGRRKEPNQARSK